jgi:hypothetical protein
MSTNTESTIAVPQLQAVCHCGQVSLCIIAAMPATITSCNCSVCHAYGHIMAYFKESEVTVTGDTDTYVHGDKMLAFHRCKNCGCHTHWKSIDETSESDRMGVNSRLLPRDILTQARVRHFDGYDTWAQRDVEKPFVRQDINCNCTVSDNN